MDKKEIRDILLGRMVRLDTQFWTAAPADAKFHFHGVRDGAGDIRLFGVTHQLRNYQIAEMEPAVAFAAAESALYSMGRPVKLASAPGAKACLYAPNWIAPVLLTVEQEGEALRMTAYTGRSLIVGRLRCQISLWLLRQRLPEGTAQTKGSQKPVEKKVEGKRSASAKREKSAVPPKKKKAAPKRLKK